MKAHTDYLNEDAFSLLLTKTAKNGTKYTLDQIISSGDYVDGDVLIEIIKASRLNLTGRDIEKLEDYIDIEELHNLIGKIYGQVFECHSSCDRRVQDQFLPLMIFPI